MVKFVLATIQQQLETVPRILTSFEQEGAASPYAWGMKRKGLDWLDKHHEQLFRIAKLNVNHDRKLLRTFLSVPGLGLVKAGFACQLFANHVGCIDTHNIKLYNIPLSALRYNAPKLPDTQRRKQNQYVRLCFGLGGSDILWTRWCDYLATVRPYNWDGQGENVSQFHVDVVTGKETGAIVDLFSEIDERPEFKRGDIYY